MKNVYHGSQINDLKKLKKAKRTHNKEWVYATPHKAIAVIFICNKAGDLNYYLGSNGTKEEPIILVERKANMFKNIFDISGSLYTLDARNFISGKTGWSAEVISEHDEEVLKEEKIKNVFEKLIELDKNKELILYLYPNRPDFIPLDNSDLIPKVIKWQKRGINIDSFFELYPELKDKYTEATKND